MPLKVKRHKRNKCISHTTNKKRMRGKHNKVPTIKSKMLEEMWNNRKSARTNLTNMGLAFDANRAVRGRIRNNESSITKEPKTTVAKLLEKQAKAPRAKDFKFPNSLATYFTYLIKKYGDDYKAMARDPKNINQETWKAIRRRILQFKKLEQYKKFIGTNK